uniref:FH2 domain-containing protein n=1 Tax=Timspurckia oligopyrenoides TaxID=708627 RepID=A0A7S0ZH98_9RHOD
MFERNDEDLVLFDDAGSFMYVADPVRHGRKAGIPALNNQDLLKITSFRYVPKDTKKASNIPSDTVKSASLQEEKEITNEKLVANSHTVEKVEQEQNLVREFQDSLGVSEKKLVALHWNKIGPAFIPGSGWPEIGKFNRLIQVDTEEVDRIFSRVVHRTELAKETELQADVLPYKRRLGISIVLSSLKMSARDLLSAVLDASVLSLDEERVSAMLAVCPTDEERELFAQNAHLIDRMDETEQFVMALCSVPTLRLALLAALRKCTLARDFDAFAARMKCVAEACKEILESSRLAPLLQVVLALGNWMNSESTSLRDAAAIKIDHVLMLASSKSQHGDLSLFDVLVDKLMQSYPELIQLREELPTVISSADRLELDTLKEQFQALQDSAKEMLDVREIASKDAQLSRVYYLELARFLGSSGGLKKVSMAEKMYDKVNERAERVMNLFCERNAKSVSRQTEVLFSLVQLCEQLEEARNRCLIRRKKSIDIHELPETADDSASSSLRPIHWVKINERLITPDSVWSKVEKKSAQAMKFDTKLIAFYFSKVDRTAQVVQEDKNESEKSISVIDSRRKHNVAILLATIQLSSDEALRLVDEPLRGIEENEEVLAALAQIAPDENEQQALLAVEKSRLDSVESYLYELAKAPAIAKNENFTGNHVKERFEALLMAQSISSNAQLLLHDMNDISRASAEIMKSEKLKRVLSLVLVFGNYLNSSNPSRANAQGFKLDGLSGLQLTKSPLKGITLLEYVVRLVQKQSPGVLPMDDELQSVSIASNHNVDCMYQVFHDIQSSLSSIRTEYGSMIESKLKKWESEVIQVENGLKFNENQLLELCVFGGEKNITSNVRRGVKRAMELISSVDAFMKDTQQIMIYAIEHYIHSGSSKSKGTSSSSNTPGPHAEQEETSNQNRNPTNTARINPNPNQVSASAAMSFYIRAK